MSVIATDALLVRVNLTTTYQIDNLTEYGFRITEAVDLDPAEIRDGTLVFTDGEEFPMRFRIRRIHAETTQCAFHKMDIADGVKLKTLVEKFADPVGDANELDGKSYDELASGDAANNDEAPSPDPQRRLAAI